MLAFPLLRPHGSVPYSLFKSSANKINNDKMQDSVGKEEVGECPLWRNALELAFVLRVYLDPEANCIVERK